MLCWCLFRLKRSFSISIACWSVDCSRPEGKVAVRYPQMTTTKTAKALK